MTASILLVGGGHAHIAALRWLMGNPRHSASITLVTPSASTVYSGMVPGFVAGHFKREDLEIDLLNLCAKAGVSLRLDRVVSFDPQNNECVGASGAKYQYDVVSVDVGIQSSPTDLPASSNAMPVKPLEAFVNHWDGLSPELVKGVAIVGGGLGGIELAMAIRQKFKASHLPDMVPISLIDRSQILSSSSPSLQRLLRRNLEALGIKVFESTTIAQLLPDKVILSSGLAVPAGQTLWAAGAFCQKWLLDSGLELKGGFPAVSTSLQSASHENVFVAGDAAQIVDHQLPKAGVHAVKQGPILMRNLMAYLSGHSLREYRPQADYLKLVTLGSKSAAAEKWGLTLKFPGLWSLKKIIDQSFVNG